MGKRQTPLFLFVCTDRILHWSESTNRRLNIRFFLKHLSHFSSGPAPNSSRVVLLSQLLLKAIVYCRQNSNRFYSKNKSFQCYETLPWKAQVLACRIWYFRCNTFEERSYRKKGRKIVATVLFRGIYPSFFYLGPNRVFSEYHDRDRKKESVYISIFSNGLKAQHLSKEL